MNTHLIRSDLESLTTNDKKKIIDFLLFLHWTRSPFKAVCNLAAPASHAWIIGCILRGAWAYTCLNGMAKGWLRISLACRD